MANAIIDNHYKNKGIKPNTKCKLNDIFNLLPPLHELSRTMPIPSSIQMNTAAVTVWLNQNHPNTTQTFAFIIFAEHSPSSQKIEISKKSRHLKNLNRQLKISNCGYIKYSILENTFISPSDLYFW